MGKVIVKNVILKNNDDYRDFLRDRLSENEIKAITIDMIADTGARFVGLPMPIVSKLGLIESEKIKAKLGDGSIKQYSIYEGLRVQINDREAHVRCIGKPEKAPCLLGQIVFEELDLVVDCPNNRVIPNPEAPEGMMFVEDF